MHATPLVDVLRGACTVQRAHSSSRCVVLLRRGAVSLLLGRSVGRIPSRLDGSRPTRTSPSRSFEDGGEAIAISTRQNRKEDSSGQSYQAPLMS